MIKQKITNALLIISCIWGNYSRAQTVQPQAESPWLDNNLKTTSLSAGILNNDFFTGTAVVNIPFWQYTANGVDLSIGMTYNTQGIQVDRTASEVGLGWDLYTGGYIQRQVRGTEDDIDVPMCGTILYAMYPAREGYWYNYAIDEEPDIFYAAFGKRSIKFLFSKNGDLLTIPYNKDIKIDRFVDGNLVSGPIPHSTHVGNLTFVITDEGGNKYYYRIGRQYTKTNNYVVQGTLMCTQTYSPVDRWVLDKVITYEGKEVDYTYDNTVVHILDHKSQNFWETNNNYGEAHETNIEQDYNLSRLLNIKYPNGITVAFSYDNNRCDLPGGSRLQSITIKERGNGIPGSVPQLYSYFFNHSYFKSPLSLVQTVDNNNNEIPLSGCNMESTLVRLKLNSIDFIGSSESQPYYSFKYNTMPLPQRVYGTRDRLGYANGTIPQLYSNGTNIYYLTIPQHSFNSTTYPILGIDNTPSFNVAYPKACMLEQITNGTNGVLNIDYGTNVSLITGIGGLHINSTLEFDGFNHDNDISKTYEYVYGKKMVSENSIVYPMSYEDGVQTNNFNDATLYSNSGNILNCAINRSDYGFQKVIELVKNPSGSQMGKNIYYYSVKTADTAINNGIDDNTLSTNISGSVDFNQPYGVPPYANKQYQRDWGIGLPMRAEKYDNNNLLVGSTQNFYTVSDTMYYDNNYKSIARLMNRSTWLNTALTTYNDEYYPFTGQAFLTKTVNDKYVNGNKRIETIVTYSYDGKSNISSIKTTNSLGEQIEQRNHYSYDWINSGINTGNVISQLNQNNIQSLIYSEKWRNFTLNGINDNYLIATSVNGLQFVGSSIIRPVYDYSLLATQPISSGAFGNNTFNHISDICSGNAVNYLLKGSSSTKFDDQGYSLEQKDISGNLYSATVWDGETGNKLAEVANARYQDIAYCGFESNYTGNSPDYKKGNWEFSNSDISTSSSFLGRYSYHLYSGNGIWTTTNLTIGQKYVVSFWLYQGGNADVNDGANPINIQSTGISYNGWTLYQKEFVAQAPTIGMWGNGYVDELRLYPTTAAMSSYTYLPLKGKTSTTDPNNKFKIYEYDDFGKISVERDQNGNVTHKYKNVTLGND